MSTVFIYMTAKDWLEADGIAKTLVERKLIACANIFPPHVAVYEWEGEVKSGTEVAIIMKSTGDKFSAIEQAVKDIHSYEVPCLIQLDIEKGHAPFLEWIEKQVS